MQWTKHPRCVVFFCFLLPKLSTKSYHFYYIHLLDSEANQYFLVVDLVFYEDQSLNQDE